MTSTNGTCNGHRAVKYSDNSIYILIAGHWYRILGQDHDFIANS
jgi:hypothetical protein